MYTLEDRMKAVNLSVDYFLEHGRSLRRSIQVLGYPNRETLRQWLDEAVPDRRGLRGRRSLQPKVELTSEQKEEAVLDLCSRDGSAKEVAAKYGVTLTIRDGEYKARSSR